MKKEEILAVVVRLFAIVLAIYAIGRLPSLAVYLHQNQAEDPGYLVLLAISGLLVFVAAFLWKFPFFIARRLLSGARSEVSLESWTAEDALETGFILLSVCSRTCSIGYSYGCSLIILMARSSRSVPLNGRTSLRDSSSLEL